MPVNVLSALAISREDNYIHPTSFFLCVQRCLDVRCFFLVHPPVRQPTDIRCIVHANLERGEEDRTTIFSHNTYTKVHGGTLTDQQ